MRSRTCIQNSNSLKTRPKRWITFRQTGAVLCALSIVFCHLHMLMRKYCIKRNDAHDAFNTYPLHQRPKPQKDTFTEGVQRTQCVSHLFLLSQLLSIRVDNPSSPVHPCSRSSTRTAS